MTGQILVSGAGRALMERRDDPLHDYTLSLTGKEDPRVLFLGTATGDDPSYILTFYETYHADRCRPAHLRLFHISESDLPAFILRHDVIHVGGGNTANMLDVWRRQGVDEVLREAWANGAVLTGGSAGAICWFEGGTTDSFGPRLQPLQDGLGFLAGSLCPHYDAEGRRPLYHQTLLDGSLPAGYAMDNFAMLQFEGTSLVGAVTSQEGQQAYRVWAEDGRVVEEPIPVTVLERKEAGGPPPPQT
ncbi:MAG TPA: peptidase E [Acidimicrobiales bacterium]